MRVIEGTNVRNIPILSLTFLYYSGSCGKYVLSGHHYVGCHCLEEYEGAHCQYLKSQPNGIGMQGEALVPELGSNFYVQTSKVKPLYALGALTIIACVCLSIASVVYMVIYHRQNKAIKELTHRLKNNKTQEQPIDVPGVVV